MKDLNTVINENTRLFKLDKHELKTLLYCIGYAEAFVHDHKNIKNSDEFIKNLNKVREKIYAEYQIQSLH